MLVGEIAEFAVGLRMAVDSYGCSVRCSAIETVI